MGLEWKKAQAATLSGPKLGKRKACSFPLILRPSLLRGPPLPSDDSSLPGPSFCSLSPLHLRALSHIKESPLHNFSSTLNTGHILRKAQTGHVTELGWGWGGGGGIGFCTSPLGLALLRSRGVSAPTSSLIIASGP